MFAHVCVYLCGVVECSFIVRWIIGSILHGGPIERFFCSSQCFTTGIAKAVWYVISCLWDSAYKRTLAANWKEEPMWQQWVSSLAI